MSDRFGDGRDPYLYPGLNIMHNCLRIHQTQRLAQAAYELAALRAATIELGPLRRGLPHLCATHRQLYRDIFDWAGHLREIDIYQGDTRFCHFAYIEKEGNALVQDLEDGSWLVGLPEGKSVDRLAHYHCEISVLHPFYTGNGLAQRTFSEQLAIHVEYMLNWDGIPVEGRNQTNQSEAIGDLSTLRAVSRKAIGKIPEIEQNSTVLMCRSRHDPVY